MASRGNPLPQAMTESAREARKTFFCDLCQKGYARMNEFEAHEGSYDHQHRKRMKDMLKLTKDSHAAARVRSGEQKANEESGVKPINISLGSSTTTGKKKPVFKSTLQPHNAVTRGEPENKVSVSMDHSQDASGAFRNGWSEDRYQPQFVTGCDDSTCQYCRAGSGSIDLQSINLDVSMKD